MQTPPPPSPPAPAADNRPLTPAIPIAAAVNLDHAKLVCIVGALQGMSFRIGSGGGLILGRAPDVDVRIPDAEISKRHAWVGVANQELRVRDLKSTNGTFLNERMNEPVTESALREGDVLILGRHDGAKFRVTFID